jgi:hypothetical protein
MVRGMGLTTWCGVNEQKFVAELELELELEPSCERCKLRVVIIWIMGLCTAQHSAALIIFQSSG